VATVSEAVAGMGLYQESQAARKSPPTAHETGG
jgi:hypothetical protein